MLLPLFSAASRAGRVVGWIPENVEEDGLVLLEDDGGDSEVSLQPVHLLPEILGQVRHVGPLLHFVEELQQAEVGKVIVEFLLPKGVLLS